MAAEVSQFEAALHAQRNKLALIPDSVAKPREGLQDRSLMELTITRARDSRALKLGVVALVVLLAVLAQRLGILQLFVDPLALLACCVVSAVGVMSCFLVSYTLLQPFGMPGTLFVMAAPLIWPWPVALALSMAGTMAASVVGFSFARFNRA